MKVLVPGNPNVRTWWWGHRVRCRDCGREVLLEKGDENTADWIPAVTSSEVNIACPTCQGVMTLKRVFCPPRPVRGWNEAEDGTK